jgi:polyhydroxyalkanoate synthesis regulator phasin
MASNERIKKYLDAGTVLGQVTRARAEEIVRELANAGDIQRDQAQEWVDSLVERSRKTSEQILDLVRHEVSAQLKKIDASSLETLAGQVADLLKRTATAGRAATADVAAQARKVAPSAKTKAPAEKPPATTTAAEDAPATKTAAKKAPATKKSATPDAAAAAPAPAPAAATPTPDAAAAAPAPAPEAAAAPEGTEATDTPETPGSST